jgi:hypothetical protein
MVTATAKRRDGCRIGREKISDSENICRQAMAGTVAAFPRSADSGRLTRGAQRPKHGVVADGVLMHAWPVHMQRCSRQLVGRKIAGDLVFPPTGDRMARKRLG